MIKVSAILRLLQKFLHAVSQVIEADGQLRSRHVHTAQFRHYMSGNTAKGIGQFIALLGSLCDPGFQLCQLLLRLLLHPHPLPRLLPLPWLHPLPPLLLL